jgi:hypothetical protein
MTPLLPKEDPDEQAGRKARRTDTKAQVKSSSSSVRYHPFQANFRLFVRKSYPFQLEMGS